MAIVRSQDGHFFEVPDEELKKFEMKPEDVPQGASGPSLSQGTGMCGPGGGGGQGGGVSPVQIIVNYVQPQGGGMQGPPPGEKAEAGAEAGAQQAQGQDVGGRYCGWHNCWRNCWRNHCW